MESMLYALFTGKINPSVHASAPDAERHPLNQSISEEKAFFKDFLSHENYERLEKLEALYTNASELSDYTAFSYGFRLATLLMFEVFGSEKPLLSD